MLTNYETLCQKYPTKIEDDEFIIAEQDGLHQDTLGESNLATIGEEINADFPGKAREIFHPYIYQLMVRVDHLKADDDLAFAVLLIMEALDSYPVYDETHYCELENQRLHEYIRERLPYDLAYELGEGVSDQLTCWISDNIETIYDYNDGSVDDAPINVKELAQEYKR